MARWLLDHKRIVWGVTLCGLAILSICFLFFGRFSRRWRVVAVSLLSLFFLSIFLAGLYYLFRTNMVREIAVRSAAEIEGQPYVEPHPDDWPWWRGPTRDNHANSSSAPVTWGPTENVIWKAEVPGSGHSSPCVCSHSVYVTTADEERQIQYLLRYDDQDGHLIWQTEIHRGSFDRKHRKNSYASSTPACVGETTYVAFANTKTLYVSAASHEGKVAWQTAVGEYESTHGYAASLGIYKSLLIVAGEGDPDPFLAAVDRATGQLVWRNRFRKSGSNYGTPIVARIADRDQIILPTRWALSSYCPATGIQLWCCRWDVERIANSPAFDSKRVYISAKEPRPLIYCVSADGNGNVTSTHVVWEARRGASEVPSPLLDGGRLYLISDNGIAACMDAASGKPLWKHRLSGNFSASPVLAAGRIYAANEKGETFVFQAGEEFNMLAVNDLREPTFASPIICADRLYLRTSRSLYCIGEPEAQASSTKVGTAQR